MTKRFYFFLIWGASWDHLGIENRFCFDRNIVVLRFSGIFVLTPWSIFWTLLGEVFDGGDDRYQANSIKTVPYGDTLGETPEGGTLAGHLDGDILGRHLDRNTFGGRKS